MGSRIKDGYEQLWKERIARGESFDQDPPKVAALRVIGSGGRLLDIGCGEGTFARLVGPRFEAIIGGDISLSALQRAEGSGLFRCAVDVNSGSLPFAENAFDAVSCLEVIEHVMDPRALVREIYRVLRKEGRLVLTTPNIRYLKWMLQLAVKGRFAATSGDSTVLFDGGHLHYFTFGDLRRILEEVGFRIGSQGGIIPTAKLAFLRGRSNWWFVREFLSAGILICARK